MYVCDCNGLTKDFILDKLNEGYSLEEIRQEYFLSLICGSCRDVADKIYEDFKKNN